jgi:hypothetical protein
MEAAMDLFRVHAQVVQLVMKMLLAVVATGLFLVARLVLPVIRLAVVALVRFPAVVADRHYGAQHAEVEALLIETRRAARTQALAPTAALAAVALVTSDSEGKITVESEPDGHVPAAVEPSAVRPAAPEPAPEPYSEMTPEPDPMDSAEADEGPVLRYRPKPASGD